jgi:outer membrane receptor protein involved in Fe transport
MIACLLAGTCSFSDRAFAQDNKEDGAATPPTIIVTARKRDEALLDVPSSVNVLSGDEIADRVLDKFDDYIRVTPGATVVNAGPDYNTDISIRGQGGGRNGFSESATGIYRNGVYIAGGGFGGRTYNRLDLFDVKQFEVYRGPQGALYGRNAVGGAVNVITAKPEADELSGQLSLNYDERDRVTVQGILNTPLGKSGSAVRFGGFYVDQSGGFITDVNTGAALDQEELYGLRGALLLALAPDWSLTLTGERYETVDSPGFSDLGRRLLGANPAATFDPGMFTRASSRSGRVGIEENSIFAELKGTIGENDLTAVFTFKDRDAARTNEDLDKFLGFQGIAASDLTVAQTEAFERYGAEIRLASPTNRAVRWLVGADFQSFDDDITTANGGISNIAALRELGQRVDRSVEELTSFSAFGLLEANFANFWTITGEVRVLSDQRNFIFQRTDQIPTPINGSFGPVNDSRDNTAVLPVVTLKRAIDGNSQAYMRFASGFRPGGFNDGTGNVNALRFDPESAYAFELGYKADWSGWQVALAAYYQRSDNLQVVTTVSETDTTTVLQNVPRADYYGFEAEFSKTFRLGPGRLVLNGSFVTAGGEFGPSSIIFVNGAAVDLSGDPVNRVRDYQVVLNLNYNTQLAGAWRGFVNLAAQVEGGGFENATGGGGRPGGRELEDFHRLDMRLGVDNGSLRASLFVQNITDEVVVLQTIQQNEYYSTPRIFGGELTFRF